jgi:HAE1 family hydrophobic/amphiphilic exporter-1
MTTIMLVAAMIPIATGRGPGAGGRASMAKVILGGQLLSLFLSLLVTPVAYSLWDDFTMKVKKVFAWLRREKKAAAEPVVLAVPAKKEDPEADKNTVFAEPVAT